MSAARLFRANLENRCAPRLVAFAVFAFAGFAFGPALSHAEAPASGGSLVEGSNEAEISKFLEPSPSHCVALNAEFQACAWRGIGNRSPVWEALAAAADTGYRVTVVCELPRSGAARAQDACTIFPAHSNRGKYRLAASAPKKKRKARHAQGAPVSQRIQQARDDARATVDSARDLRSLVALAGDVPEQCSDLPGGGRSCSWRLDGRTWGHGTLGAAFDHAMDKRLRFRCGFEADGSVRDDCSLQLDE